MKTAILLLLAVAVLAGTASAGTDSGLGCLIRRFSRRSGSSKYLDKYQDERCDKCDKTINAIERQMR
jgi:hypothetical protein